MPALSRSKGKTMNIAEITEQQVTDRAKAALPAELSLHKIAFFHSKGNTRIVIQLDKESDKYGSVNIRECEQYARSLRDALDEHEKTSGINLNYSLEVSSAGAERELASLVATITPEHPERIAENWSQESGSIRVLRDYYVARTPDHKAIWIFREKTRNTWFLQGVFC